MAEETGETKEATKTETEEASQTTGVEPVEEKTEKDGAEDIGA